jgi:hypothetical protein
MEKSGSILNRPLPFSNQASRGQIGLVIDIENAAMKEAVNGGGVLPGHAGLNPVELPKWINELLSRFMWWR